MFYGKTIKMSKCAIFEFSFLCVKTKNGHFKMSKLRFFKDGLKKIKNHLNNIYNFVMIKGNNLFRYFMGRYVQLFI